MSKQLSTKTTTRWFWGQQSASLWAAQWSSPPSHSTNRGAIWNWNCLEWLQNSLVSIWRTRTLLATMCRFVCSYLRYLMQYLKVLPLDNETTPDPSPVAGFTLEMKRKPAKYAFLYFLPSGHNCSFIKSVWKVYISNDKSFKCKVFLFLYLR